LSLVPIESEVGLDPKREVGRQGDDPVQTFPTLGSGTKSPETLSPFHEEARFVRLAGTFCPKHRATTRHKHLFTAGSCYRHCLCTPDLHGTIHR